MSFASRLPGAVSSRLFARRDEPVATIVSFLPPRFIIAALYVAKKPQAAEKRGRFL
jgi:hypothetical protein